MRWSLVLLLSGTLLAQGEGQEEMHGATGASFSASPGDRNLGTAWITNFGSRLWITPRTGIRSDLSYQRFSISDQLRGQIPVGVRGFTEITSLNLSGFHRGSSGFYLQGGIGIYRRAVVATNVQGDLDLPCNTRGGWNAGLGWESRNGFFVEVSFHRIETPGGPTDMLPIVVGSWF